jgi:hypothetical protein
MTINRWFTTRMVGPDYSPRYVVRDKRQSGAVWSRVKILGQPSSSKSKLLYG